jgi:sugar phosphate permease
MTSRYRWTILAVGVGAQTAISALRQGLPSLGPALRGAYGLSLPQVGVVFASVTAGIVLTLLPWGWLADRAGERPVLGIGLTGAAVALVGAAYAPTFEWLLVALVAAGMAGASATGASGRAVMGWFGRAERGLALGIRQMGVPLGGALAAISLPLIAAAAGLRAAMLALAAGCLIGALASARWMREPPPAPAGRPVVDAPAPMRDSRLWRLAAGSGLLVIAQSALLGFTVLYLHDERGWSAAAAAALFAGIQIAGAVARVAVGGWSDRAGRRVVPLRRLGATSAVLLAAAAVLADAPGLLLVPLLATAAVFAMSWNGLSFTAAAEMSGRERAGTAIGVQNTVLSIGGVVAPVAFGAAVVAASWPVAWALLALSQVAGLRLLRPLVAEEEDRNREREARLSVPASSPRRATCNPSPGVAAHARGARA